MLLMTKTNIWNVAKHEHVTSQVAILLEEIRFIKENSDIQTTTIVTDIERLIVNETFDVIIAKYYDVLTAPAGAS